MRISFGSDPSSLSPRRARPYRATVGQFDHQDLSCSAAGLLGIAQMEIDEADWEHGDLFARKGIAAGNGEMVMPEDPANWMLPANMADEFGSARQRLLAALDGNGRTKAPSDAARAQAMYDCWIQEQELKNEGHQLADIEACRKGF
jgi:OOP family OmpA-OmpF porin